MSWTAKRYHDFSCGHRVFGHESKCAHLHGHNYRVTFTCAASELDSVGRVIDFSAIKAFLCDWLEENWDHCFLLWNIDPLLQPLTDMDPDGVVSVPFNPTAENMAQFLVEFVGPQQLRGTGIRLVHCEVEETRKCSATYEVAR
jgi:6-pyruvoyltetrahydropterin/6-carboxytetrahydropterin synthase